MITNSWLYLSPRFNKNAQQLSLCCIRQSKGVKKLSTDFFHFLLLATHCRFTWTWLGLGLKQKNACTFRFRSMASVVLAVISCLAHSAVQERFWLKVFHSKFKKKWLWNKKDQLPVRNSYLSMYLVHFRHFISLLTQFLSKMIVSQSDGNFFISMHLTFHVTFPYVSRYHKMIIFKILVKTQIHENISEDF